MFKLETIVDGQQIVSDSSVFHKLNVEWEPEGFANPNLLGGRDVLIVTWIN